MLVPLIDLPSRASACASWDLATLTGSQEHGELGGLNDVATFVSLSLASGFAPEHLRELVQFRGSLGRLFCYSNLMGKESTT